MGHLHLIELPIPANPLGSLNGVLMGGGGTKFKPDLTVAKRTAVACCDACESLCKPVRDMARRSPYSYGGGLGSFSSVAPRQQLTIPESVLDKLDKGELMALASQNMRVVP